MTNTGTLLVRLLEAYGVDTVFGIPGVHTVELYRALAGSAIRHVTPRHEQGAGFMADGYARVSGKPGVCFVITGPGLTNIATPMAQAYGDSIPMLVISAVNSHGRMGTGEGWLHELPDQHGLAGHLCAFSHTVHRPEELAPALARAFAVFDAARPRPVHLEIPINVLTASADHVSPPATVLRLQRPEAPREPLAEAARLLSAAARPVILAGGGAIRGAEAVRRLAERLDAPLVMTTNGRGLVPAGHPLGVSLSASFPASRALIRDSDVVLALGTEMGPTDYDMYEDGGLAMPGTLIRIDLDPAQVVRGMRPALGLVADAAAAAGRLAEMVAAGERGGAARVAALRQPGSSDLSAAMQGDLRILHAVRALMPDAIFVGDSTQLTYAGNCGFEAAQPGSWFNSATGYGTLGYGLPAAVGAKLANPDRPVIAIVGDGGLQFTLPELASARDAGTAIVMLLHDNHGYGEIKNDMLAKGIAPLGVDLYAPDFLAIATAYGWRSIHVDRLADLLDALPREPADDRPLMIHFGDALRRSA